MKYNKSEKDSVDKTSQILKEGGIAIIPTDTEIGRASCRERV